MVFVEEFFDEGKIERTAAFLMYTLLSIYCWFLLVNKQSEPKYVYLIKLDKPTKRLKNLQLHKIHHQHCISKLRFFPASAIVWWYRYRGWWSKDKLERFWLRGNTQWKSRAFKKYAWIFINKCYVLRNELLFYLKTRDEMIETTICQCVTKIEEFF